MRISLLLTFLFSCLLVNIASSQYLGGLHSKWDDSFREWEITYYVSNPDSKDEDDAFLEKAGDLSLRWVLQNDWSVWDYEIGDQSGDIRQKWDNNPELWELQADNETITIRTIWPGDLTQWKVSNGKETIFIQSRFRNNVDEWHIRKHDLGYFEIFTDVQGDARDWIIDDGLNEAVSVGFKLALAFVAVYHSSPKH